MGGRNFALKLQILIFIKGWIPALTLDDYGACDALVDPDHGHYVCRQNRNLQQVCKLKCHAGYTMPFTQYYAGKKLSFTERGTYICMEKDGLPLAWYPVEVFDCVEIVYPTQIQLYFYLKIPMTPRKCDESKTEQLTDKFLSLVTYASNTANLCQRTNATCSWKVVVLCVGSVWTVDVILSIPFSKDKLVDWPKQVNREMVKDIPYFKVKGQSGGQTKKGRRAFLIVCPAGTRISQDLLCHGCSAGYYMDESIMECQPCPKRYFQDLASQTVCKSCPHGTPGSSIAGTHITSCYSIGQLTQRTDILTVTGLITAIMAIVSILLAYRYRIQYELFEPEQTMYFPDLDTVRCRFSDVSSKAVVLSSISSSGDPVDPDQFTDEYRLTVFHHNKHERGTAAPTERSSKFQVNDLGHQTHLVLMRKLEEHDSKVAARKVSEKREPRERDQTERRKTVTWKDSEDEEPRNSKRSQKREPRERKESEKKELGERKHSEGRKSRERRQSVKKERRARKSSEEREHREGESEKRGHRERNQSEERESRERKQREKKEHMERKHSEKRESRERKQGEKKESRERKHSEKRESRERKQSQKREKRAQSEEK